MTKNKALERVGSKFDPEQVRYIKLGREGCWEKECLEEGIIRFGFGSATDERFALCSKRKWGALAKSFMAEGKAKGTATRFTNETRLFCDDDGSMLWITFIGARFGKTQKTLDLDLYLPSTGERAFVQVKSKTTSAELVEYVESLNELDSFNRMFFVYHSGEAETDDERVIVIGPDKLSEMAVDAGLVTWLIRKVS